MVRIALHIFQMWECNYLNDIMVVIDYMILMAETNHKQHEEEAFCFDNVSVSKWFQVILTFNR